MLIDSHTHLSFLDDPLDKWASARAAGVSGALTIAVDEASAQACRQLSDELDGVWATAGVHPDAADQPLGWLDHVDWNGVVAVGETGLDYFHEDSPALRARQHTAFDRQLTIAREQALPVVIHTRSADADTRSMLKKHAGVRGVLHCFTESWELAKFGLDLGYYVSISGIVTFKNADNVREVARQVPMDRLLVETDAPYLAPVPHRGKTNEPAWVADTARYLAELRGFDFDDFATQTSDNFFRLFRRADRGEIAER